MKTTDNNKTMTAEDVLNKYGLHEYYHPNGNLKKNPIHDIDCKFCYYEDYILKAMQEYADYYFKAKLNEITDEEIKNIYLEFSKSNLKSWQKGFDTHIKWFIEYLKRSKDE